jgi:hypothetical protein
MKLLHYILLTINTLMLLINIDIHAYGYATLSFLSILASLRVIYVLSQPKFP